MPEAGLKVLQFVRGSERYGASVSIRNLCAGLRTRGHEIVLTVYKGRSLGSEMGEKGFRLIELEPHNKFNLRRIFGLRRLFLNEEPDIIHTHLSAATISGTIAARLARIPVVSTVHGMNLRWSYSFADHLIAVSEAGKNNLVQQGLRAAKVSVAYNGIPMPNVAPSIRGELRHALGIEPDAVVMGSVSRADYGKGIHDAINAIAILRRKFKNLRYLFAGEGDYLDALKAQAQALGLLDRIFFLGFREDVGNVLSSLDLFLFPSLKEAMGISIVEAMSMSLPIVGTRVGGIPEVIDEGSGVLVPPSNPAALAEACEPLLSKQELREAMGSHARIRAEELFSLEASAKAVEDVYRVVLKKGGADKLANQVKPC